MHVDVNEVLNSFLKRADDFTQELDAWPHLLWLAPGIEDPC
ncbi:MAG: hypothetical protein WA005_10235 [Candidatus Binataceae bacterium]